MESQENDFGEELALSSELPPALREAIKRKRLLIFAGAGVSLLPPSSLPDWFGFNEAILEESKASALRIVSDLDRSAAEEIQAINLKEFPVQSFSDLVVRCFAGESYFSVIEVLDSEFTNANHSALAELSRSGILRSIVTTNFDTLIERAFRQAGVGLNVVCAPDDYAFDDPLGKECFLYKIHGSTTNSKTLVDTVSQKVRGLSLYARARLAHLYSRFHVVVLGFSGADLEFGKDYLALSAVSSAGPGVTWVTRRGGRITPLGQNVVDRAGGKGAVLSAELPDFFQQLGARIPRATGSPTTSQEANRQARERVRRFLGELHAGPFASAALCSHLLLQQGKYSAAKSLSGSLVKALNHLGNRLPITTLFAFGALESIAIYEHDFEEGERWAREKIALIDSWDQQLFTGVGNPPTASILREWQSNLSAAWSNIGLCHIFMGKLDEARMDLEKALELASAANDLSSSSVIHLNFAQLAKASDETVNFQIEYLRLAELRAREAGSAQILYEAALLEAKALISICEYASAAAALERARKYGLLVGPAAVNVLNVELAELKARRRQLDAARELILNYINSNADVDRLRCAKARIKFAFLLSFHKPFCPEIVHGLEWILEEMNSGRLPKDGGEGLPSFEAVLRRRNEILEGSNIDTPNFLLHFRESEPGSELRLRQEIAVFEFRGEMEKVAERFRKLLSLTYYASHPRRRLDLGNCLYECGVVGDDRSVTRVGLETMATAYQEIGELREAAETWERALALEPTGSSEERAFLMLGLARSKIKLGLGDEATKLLKSAEDVNFKLRDPIVVFRNAVAIARLFAELDGPTAALRVLERYRHLREEVSPDELESEATLLATLKQNSKIAALRERPLFLFLEGQSPKLNPKQIESLEHESQGPEDWDTLGRIALDSGDLRNARRLFLMSVRAYSENGRTAALSQSLLNLAAIASMEGRWYEAIEHYRETLEIRKNLGDRASEIRASVALASAYLEVENYPSALNLAQNVLTQLQSAHPSLYTLVALDISYEAYHANGNELEAVGAIRRFVELFPHVEDAEPLARYQEGFVAALENIETLMDSESERDLFSRQMREAERLQLTGKLEPALKILKELEARYETVGKRAEIARMRANAYQTAGLHKEAIAWYEEASLRYRLAGSTDEAASAEVQRANSLRMSGDRSKAEAELRRLVSIIKEGRHRFYVLHSLGNVITEGLSLDPERRSATLIRDARSAYDEALGISEISVEERGLAYLNMANVDKLEGNWTDALHKLELARQHLLRSNSRYLEVCENAIRMAEREAIE
jgi:tetratricopeptide (TPR) repeat protein